MLETTPKKIDEEEEVKETEQNINVEKSEEEKLKQKYPTLAATKNSQFLQRKIQQRQKFFDSGDYNMAKAKGLKLSPFAKPTSAVQASAARLKVVVDEPDGSTSPTGTEIPTPNNVPARKASIIQPEVQSKLSPQPVVHHPSEPTELLQIAD